MALRLKDVAVVMGLDELVIRPLASIENPLCSQASTSAAAEASSRPLNLNQRITRRRTRSVSVAR